MNTRLALGVQWLRFEVSDVHIIYIHIMIRSQLKFPMLLEIILSDSNVRLISCIM